MPRHLASLLTPLLAATLLFAACNGSSDATPTSEVPPTGGNDPTAPPGDATDPTMPPDAGPPITVAEALTLEAGETFVVTGYLFVKADDTLVLADEIAESYPPQPAGAQLPVTGFDPLTLPLIEGPTDSEIAITAWTETPIQLHGSITDGVLIATPDTAVIALVSSTGSGPGISVAAALASTLDSPLLVNGFIFTISGEVRLCTSLPREEYPTCGDPSLPVEGVDPAAIEGIEFLEGRGWSDQPTQLLGTMVDGVLTVSGTVLAQ
jgi:hypothetical protein